MVTSDERLRVLRMVQEGKISAEEGIRLMDALSETGKEKPKSPAEQYKTVKKTARWFRVRVTDQITGKVKVDIHLPINVVKAGSKLGARFSPEVSGIDMEQIMEHVDAGTTGRIFDLVHESDQELVEVFIE